MFNDSRFVRLILRQIQRLLILLTQPHYPKYLGIYVKYFRLCLTVLSPLLSTSITPTSSCSWSTSLTILTLGALAWLIILQINVRTLQVQRLSAEYIKLSNQRTDKPNTSHDTSHDTTPILL